MPALLALVSDDLLEQALYRSPFLIPAAISPGGAVSVNALWESSGGGEWFIEMQRFGAELVQAGVVCGRKDWIERGLQIVGWGFARQGPDGDFPGGGDPYHSTELFVEGAARCVLLLQQGNVVDFLPRIELSGCVQKIHAAALWLVRPDVAGPGRRNNAPFVHRCWIMAAALAMAAAVSGDESLSRVARERAEEGLAQQSEDGVNPERGGFDVNYQSAGLLFAARYHAVCPDAALRDRIGRMIRRGLDWLSARVDESGEVATAGSTRVGKEALRSGGIKKVNEWELVQTFCYGAAITGDVSFRDAARLLVNNVGGAATPDQLL